jgi:hypothetical protein
LTNARCSTRTENRFIRYESILTHHSQTRKNPWPSPSRPMCREKRLSVEYILMHHKGTIQSPFGTRLGPDPDSSALFVAHVETRSTLNKMMEDLSSVPRATTKSQDKMAMRLTAPELSVPSTLNSLLFSASVPEWKAATFPVRMQCTATRQRVSLPSDIDFWNRQTNKRCSG